MIRDWLLSISAPLIFLPIVVFSLSACGREKIDPHNTTNTTPSSTTLLPEPTRTLSLYQPDTVRETSWAKATEDVLKPPTPTPTPSGTPSPTIPTTQTEITTFSPTFTSMLLGELTLDDYILAPEDVFTYSSDDRGNTLDFFLHIPDTIYDRRKDLWEQPPEADLTLSEINQKLSAFGYRVEETGSEGGWTIYSLFEGQNLVQDDIRDCQKIILNPSGTDFALVFNHGMSRDLGYARKGSVDPYWNTMGGYDWFSEVDLAFFIEDDLLRVNFTDSPIVIRNDEIIYTHAVSYIGPSHCPLLSFRRWKDQWVMGVDGEVIINSGSSFTRCPTPCPLEFLFKSFRDPHGRSSERHLMENLSQVCRYQNLWHLLTDVIRPADQSDLTIHDFDTRDSAIAETATTAVEITRLLLSLGEFELGLRL